ncbi:bestrophin family protein [Flaviaesturariibacter amylovorans]|uniref:Bestrophin family ion channel n=1 Tax=Flaviaesturariibacter amylovorans TaxID=1084520 RepID=A0ABP8G7Y0_9BACT
MISYNPKDWIRFIFDLHRSDTLVRLLPLLTGTGLYAAGIVWCLQHWVADPANSPLRQLSVLHGLLGFAISILVVFRTNTAYDRWWEGRRQWGALVNNSRNFAIKLNAMLPGDDDRNRTFFKQLLPRFAHELMIHLQSEETRYSLDEQPHPEIPDFDRRKHVPNQVASLLASRLAALHRQGTLSDTQLLLLNGELSSLLDICGACERIKNTPIPYSYSAFIKKFIFFYVLSLPVGYGLGLQYWIVPVTLFVLYVLASLELIAEEIEDPFGKDTNDLPMGRLVDTIRRNVQETLA